MRSSHFSTRKEDAYTVGEIHGKTKCKRGFQKASSVPWPRCTLVVSSISHKPYITMHWKGRFTGSFISCNGEFSLPWMGGMGSYTTAIGVAVTELTAIH